MSSNVEVGKMKQDVMNLPNSSVSPQYTCPECPHPTKATKREVCRNFQHSRCRDGKDCKRLHVHQGEPPKCPIENVTVSSPKTGTRSSASKQPSKADKPPSTPKIGEPASLVSTHNIPCHVENKTTSRSETPVSITPVPPQTHPSAPQSQPTNDSTTPRNAPSFACRNCPHPTRATTTEVCRLFRKGRCKMGAKCSWRHVHNQPPIPEVLRVESSPSKTEPASFQDSNSICMDFLMGNCQKRDCKKIHSVESSPGGSTSALGSRTPTTSAALDGIKVVEPQANAAYVIKLPSSSPTQLPAEFASAEKIDNPKESLPPPLIKPLGKESLTAEDDSVLSDFSSSSSSSNYSTANSRFDSIAESNGSDDAHSAFSDPESEAPLDDSCSTPLAVEDPPLGHSAEQDGLDESGEARGTLPQEVCRRHALHQSCPYQRSCQFLHIDPPKVDALRKRSLEIRKRLQSQPCTAHLRGRCYYGDKCSRPHVNSGNPTVLVPNPPCRRWMMGKCDRGDECHFDHEKASFKARTFTAPLPSDDHSHTPGYDQPPAHRWALNKSEGCINPGTPPSTLYSGTSTPVLPAWQAMPLNRPNSQGHNHTPPYVGNNYPHTTFIGQPIPKPTTSNIHPGLNLPPRLLAQLQSQPCATLPVPQLPKQVISPRPSTAPLTPLRPPGLPSVPTHKHSPAAPLLPTAARTVSPSPHHWSVDVDTHTKVRLSSGFNVESIMTGFESNTVVLENIPETFAVESIQKLGERFGVVVNVTRPGICFVKFAETDAASKAVAGLNGTQVAGNTIAARLECEQSRHGFRKRAKDNIVRVDWDAPQRTAYAGFNELKFAETAISIMNKIEIGGMVVSASLHNGLPAVRRYNVRLAHLPIQTNEGDLRKLWRKKRIPDEQFPEEIVWGPTNYESLPGAKQYIRGLLDQCGELLEFEYQSPIVFGNIRGWAHFSTSASAGNAASFIHGRRPLSMNKTKIYAHRVYTIEYKLAPAIFNDAANDVDLLRKQAWLEGRRHASLHVPPPRIGDDGEVSSQRLIRISASEKHDLLKLKADLEMAIYGEVVRDEEDKIVWDNFFRYSVGAEFCSELQRQHPGVRIMIQTPRHTVRIFGPLDKRAIVRRAMLERVATFRGCVTHTIPISGQIIGIFMQTELPQLLRTLGQENVTLQLWEHNVLVRGSPEAYETALATVRRCEQEHTTVNVPPEEQCTVCFDQVTRPVYLPCGHRYCHTCLEGYLISSVDNKSFPLQCLGDEAKCSELIPLPVARLVLDPSQFESITHAAFQAYVHARPEEFHHCPTPDCEQVYRHGPENTFIQCPSCTIRICPACHVEYHEGVRCEDYDEVGDKAFMAWARAHGIKNCPGCRVPIEKVEGCNHMTCTRCQTHVCWVCMETFPKGEGIYAHMRVKHGGFGLEDPFE